MTFEEFAAARLPALLRYAAVLTGDSDQARDLVQTVLARAFVSWGRIMRSERPEAYVHRMVTNEFLNSRRGRRPRLVELTREVVSGRRAPTVADHAEQVGERGELWQRLQGLPPRQRAVLVLRYYEGLPDREIAGVLGCTSGTVRGYASRAMAALRIERPHRVRAAARAGEGDADPGVRGGRPGPVLHRRRPGGGPDHHCRGGPHRGRAALRRPSGERVRLDPAPALLTLSAPGQGRWTMASSR